jgi:O-antigen/teichoic acid export membrane protein
LTEEKEELADVLVQSGRTKHIVSGVRSLTIQNIVNSLLSTVFLALLLRLLSPAEYGIYSAVVLVTLIGSSIASFGLQFAATRFVALMSYDEGESRVVSRSILILSLLFASLSTFALVLLSPSLSLYFTQSTSSSWIFAASGAWLFSGAISGIFQGLVQGMKKYESLAKILMTAGSVMVCVTVLGLLVFNSVLVPIIAWVIYGGVICFWSLVITRHAVSSRRYDGSDSRNMRQILKYSIPLGIAGIVTVATGAADPMVVGGVLSVTELGAYNAAIAISGGLGVVFFSPMNTAFFPETSSSPLDHGRLSTGLRLAFRYSILALIPASFALAALSTQMIDLFSGGGSSYLVANLSLQLMSVFFIFVAMQGIPTSLLLSTGKTTQVMLIGIATVVLDVFLSELLVPNFGLLGATTSRVLVDIAGFLMAAYLTKGYFRNVIDVGFYAKVIMMSIVMFGVLAALSEYVSNSIVTLVPYILVGSGVLLVCTKAFRILTEEDKRYLEHFVPGKLGNLIELLL